MANSENVAASSQAEGLFGAVDGAVGLGVDIVEIERMRKILKRSPAFARKVFSCEECCYCDATSQPEVHYATRFAAKEAVLKALGTGFSEGIGVRDVEVRRTSKGRPYAVLSGRAKQVAQSLGVRELPLSLSFTHTDAVRHGHHGGIGARATAAPRPDGRACAPVQGSAHAARRP